ncbi:MAG: class I SAM-dependent methyltransferase [Vulcanimicrobiaceae bacterium]
MHDHHHHHGDRHGAKQPEIFSHARAAMLDDPAREAWLPTPALLQILDAPQGSRVLDFGAGTGRYAIPLAELRPDLQVVAYDVQPEMVATVRTRALERGVQTLKATHDAAELAPHSFSRALVVNVLHEIGDIDVARIASLMQPDGVALFVDWDGGVSREVGPPNDHVHTKAEAIARLERLGLRNVCDAGTPHMPNHYVLRAHPAT